MYMIYDDIYIYIIYVYELNLIIYDHDHKNDLKLSAMMLKTQNSKCPLHC